MRSQTAGARQRDAIALVLAAFLAAAAPALAQEAGPEGTAEVYRTPPPEMAALVDQPQTPTASLAPGDPELRIDPANTGPSRTGYVTSLTLLDVATGDEREVTGLPESPRIRNLEWAADGTRFAFTLDRPDRIELWTADVAGAAARRSRCRRAATRTARPWRR